MASSKVQQAADAAVQTAQKLTIAGSGTAGAGGLWAWFGEHHQEIGAVCAMVGAVCAVGGLVFTIWKGMK
jgi:hypothetical protein